ncbi:MAG TPA: Asp-tRNA(Asn)/Glu-tRNA(Gln) amidotransferase subunit GatC [Steroidobacteraceae bacterium]|jgi:aspartyl-tRNA(Asn)/glutamyl-tRNA(Gln) amidotransferase subunit C
MSLANDDVRRIARLARIAITEDEAAQVLERLNRVLALIDEMRAVDVSGVEPMAHARELGQRLREDKVTESDRHELYQSVAPAVEADLYLVPKVIE